MKLSKQQLEEQKCELLATRLTTEQAFDYALQLARAAGMPEEVMANAILVYQKALIDQLVPFGEDEEDYVQYHLGLASMS